MGRRRRKLRKIVYNDFAEDYIIEESSGYDDTRRYSKVSDTKALRRAMAKDGATQDYLEQLTYFEGESLKINKAAVQREAATIRAMVKDARFAGIDEYERENKSKAERYKLPAETFESMNERDFKNRAQAVLTAAKVGKVELSAYDKGVLRKLAAGRYKDVVFGHVKDEYGRRTYERGTFRSQYRGKNTGRKSARQQAIADEMRDKGYLKRGRTVNKKNGDLGRLLANVSEPQQKTKVKSVASMLDDFASVDF
jgi:hypothetical protein